MEKEKLLNLYKFIEFLKSNQIKFENQLNSIAKLKALDIELNEIDPNINIIHKKRSIEIENEINETMQVLRDEVITPTKEKIKELNICVINDNDIVRNSLYNIYNSVYFKLSETADLNKNEIEKLKRHIIKYIEFRKATERSHFFINDVFDNLDEVLVKFYNYFIINDSTLDINTLNKTAAIKKISSISTENIITYEKVNDNYILNLKNGEVTLTEKEFNEANKKAEFLKEYCSRIIEKSKNKNLTLENTPKALFKVVEIDMFVEDIIKENEKLKNEGKDNKKLIERTELLIKIIKSIIKDPLLEKEYKDIYEYFNSQLTLLFESKILIKTESQPQPSKDKYIKIEKLSDIITDPNSVNIVNGIKTKYKNIKGKRLKLLLMALQQLELIPKERIAFNFHKLCKKEFNWNIASYNAMNCYKFNENTDKDELSEIKTYLKELIKTK